MSDIRAATWFTVLGPVRAWRGSSELRLGSPQQRAVLAALLVREGAQASIGELIDGVWGSGDIPDSAGQVIRTYIHRLRRVLDPGRPAAESVIASVGDGYALRAGEGSLDLGVFRQHVADAEAAVSFRDLSRARRLLREALALWQGVALAGIPGEYAETQRVYLSKLRLAAMEALMAAQLDLGAYTEAAAELATITAEYPFDERFREFHMTALHRSGRQAEALAVYQQCQKLFVDELGLDPGPGLQELYARVLRGDLQPDLAQRPGTGSSLPVPAQLPADHRDFTGRIAELSEAVQNLDRDRGRATVALITGMAGVGKTTFAVHLGHRIANRYPDGQLYLDLRGFGPAGDQVAPEDALYVLLEALGVPVESMPTDLTGRAALLRSLLAGRRMLVLLDNAKDAAQVRPLLPGVPTSLVLITSRDRLTGLLVSDDADLIKLDVLAPADARTFLIGKLGARRVTAEPQAADEILERCGRLPLAISLVAARAIVNPAFSLSAIAAELRRGLDAFEDLDGGDVRSVFSWSYNSLTPESARLFRLLSLAPWAQYDLTAAGSLAGLPINETRRLIAELIRVNLLAESLPGEFTFHDLIRAYATDLAAAVEQPTCQDVLVRALNHTVHNARAAVQLLRPHRDPIALVTLLPGVSVRPIADRSAAWAWFSTQYTVIVSSMRKAYESGLDEYVCQLAWTLNTYLYRAGHWEDLIAAAELALAAATRMDDQLLIAKANHVLGNTETWLYRFEAADAHLNRAIAVYRAARSESEEATAIDSLGNLRSFEGRSVEAIQQYQKVLRMTSDDLSQASALNNLANEYNATGDHVLAVSICLQAVELWTKFDDQHSLANSWDTLGSSYQGLGDFEQAASYYRLAFEGFRDLGNRYNEAKTLINYAISQQALDDTEAAHRAVTSAVAILRDLKHPDAETVADEWKLPTLT
ncbi:BTAD domain-containing putative transcriptional regulator [Kribbella qitaiheensis]|uniref:AfsR/SARP family transcriptional regulator n=1 Tax=Kribbella qitaiheensis TaxID=1544730 RepID=UPI00361BA55F